MKSKPNFQFYNQLSPRYIEHLFLQMEANRWYASTELRTLLRRNLEIDGSDVVQRNIEAWGLAGLGETRLAKEGKSKVLLFRLTEVGQQVIESYSTNKELFFDVIHFMFYSAWIRYQDPYRGRFWIYASVCNELWKSAPSKMDSFGLTAKLQSESMELFPEVQPTFPERSVRAVFPWLGAVTPPFLEKCGTQSQLCSSRRNFCTPQLFHLATDLVYTYKALKYGTSIAVDDEVIEFICKTCLLDPNQFWEIADRTKLSVRGFEIRKGQWGTSLALNEPPAWIKLPDFQRLTVNDSDEEGDEE